MQTQDCVLWINLIQNQKEMESAIIFPKIKKNKILAFYKDINLIMVFYHNICVNFLY